MLKWINKKRNNNGFTLVELVVVIAIMGILTTIAIPKLGKSRDMAKIAAHNANVRVLKSAAVMYLVDEPTTAKGTILLGNKNAEKDVLLQYLDLEEAPVPYDEKATYFKVLIDENGNVKVDPEEK